MEAAADLDAADYVPRSNYSGAGSKSSRSASGSGSRGTGITGVDVESGEAASLVGGRGHRSTYAALAEEALLGGVPPSDLFDSPFEPNQPIELTPSEFQDAHGATWRMGSAGNFWRLEAPGLSGGGATGTSLSARCCMSEESRHRTLRRGSTALTACAAMAAALGVVAAFGAVRSWLDPPQDETAPLAPHLSAGLRSACCTAVTAACFACRVGLSVEDFCKHKGSARGISGCEAAAQVARGEGHQCCDRGVAECLACREGLRRSQYCELHGHGNITGCGADRCGLVERDVEYTGGDLYSVGNVASAGACCDICREEAKCTSWTWAGSSADKAVLRERCFLKRQAELLFRRRPGSTSGLPRRDEVGYQLKLRHGLCLTARPGGGLGLEACLASDRPVQHFLLLRKMGRLVLADGGCLQGSAHRDGPVSRRPCDSSLDVQQWSFDAVSGELRLRAAAGAGNELLCLHAPHRTREGGEVIMHTCRGGAEEQQWSFWSSSLLGRDATVEAMAREAVQTTTTTSTSTSTQVVTTTLLPTLFCFSVMVSWNYEPDLVRMQVRDRRSIFRCDGYAVYSNEELDLGGGLRSRVVQGTDLKCKLGGEFHTLLNTPVFQKVWDQVLNDGLFQPYDWVAKVDCDAVFFPERLRALVQGPAFANAQEGNGKFINNCGFGLHGPLEIISRRALLTYNEAWTHCDEPPQEDVYLQACMNKLGATQVNAFKVLAEEACKTPDWQSCQSSHVAFHPFKQESEYKACQDRGYAA